MMVVQLGLAMMPRGRLRASAALHSGTTRGTSSSMRKALELSIITAPYFVMSAANSFAVPAPAEVKAMSTSLKSSLCCSSFTVYSLPRKVYWVPALRLEPNSRRLSMGKSRPSRTRRNSWPTAPLAPTIAMFIVCQFAENACPSRSCVGCGQNHGSTCDASPPAAQGASVPASAQGRVADAAKVQLFFLIIH